MKMATITVKSGIDKALNYNFLKKVAQQMATSCKKLPIIAKSCFGNYILFWLMNSINIYSYTKKV